MRFKEIQEASLLGQVGKQLTKQLELPLEPAVKAVVTPKRVEYWGYLPGETATSRPFFRQTFNSEEEAQAWMRRKNATPQGSKQVD